jgi:hypothetical protein
LTVIADTEDGRVVTVVPLAKGIVYEVKNREHEYLGDSRYHYGPEPKIEAITFTAVEPDKDSNGIVYTQKFDVDSPDQNMDNLLYLALDEVETEYLVTVEQQVSMAKELGESLRKLGYAITPIQGETN